MNNSTTHQPLTDDELDRLAEFLDAIGPPALNLESLDGYFAALICGPDVVLPSEYLPDIWGEDYSFASNEQVADIVGLLMRHWNTIVSALQRTLGLGRARKLPWIGWRCCRRRRSRCSVTASLCRPCAGRSPADCSIWRIR